MPAYPGDVEVSRRGVDGHRDEFLEFTGEVLFLSGDGGEVDARGEDGGGQSRDGGPGVVPGGGTEMGCEIFFEG